MYEHTVSWRNKMVIFSGRLFADYFCFNPGKFQTSTAKRMFLLTKTIYDTYVIFERSAVVAFM